MPDDAAKTTDATPRSAREAKIVRAPSADAQGAATNASVTAAVSPEAAARTDGGAAVGPQANAKQKAEGAARTEPELAMPIAAAGAAAKGATLAGDEATLFGALNTDERIRATSQQGCTAAWP